MSTISRQRQSVSDIGIKYAYPITGFSFHSFHLFCRSRMHFRTKLETKLERMVSGSVAEYDF